jgi:hypothetical protein
MIIMKVPAKSYAVVGVAVLNTVVVWPLVANVTSLLVDRFCGSILCGLPYMVLISLANLTIFMLVLTLARLASLANAFMISLLSLTTIAIADQFIPISVRLDTPS